MNLRPNVLLFPALFACTSFLTPSVQAGASRMRPQPALLKVGPYFVVYTEPFVPRQTESGDFVVGLSAMALLLGAKIAPAQPSASMTLLRAGQTVRFTNGSKTASVNGKPFRMETAAAQDPLSGQMRIPLSPLIHAFHLRARWDWRSHILSLPDVKIVNGYNDDEVGYVRGELPGPRSAALLPVAVSLVPHIPVGKEAPRRKDSPDLRVVVKNISRRTIPNGRIFINFLAAYNYQRAGHTSTVEENINTNQISYMTEGHGGLLFEWPFSPSLGPGQTRTTTLINGLNSQSSPGVALPNKTVYVLAWPVVSKKYNRPSGGVQ